MTKPIDQGGDAAWWAQLFQAPESFVGGGR